MANSTITSPSNGNPTVIQIPSSVLRAAAGKKRDEDLTLSELWFLCLGHWRWFVISVLVCLGAVSLHLLRTPKTYTRKMQVLIKSNQKDDNVGSMADFAEMGIIQGSSNVNNELIAMLSPALALDVVKEMELNTSYQRPGFFQNTTLYGASLPVRVEFCDMQTTGAAAFRMELNPDGSYRLSDMASSFDLDNTLDGKTFTGKLSADTVQTPLGRLLVMPSGNFIDAEKSQTILVSHRPAMKAIGLVSGNLKAEAIDKLATVVMLTFTDVNPLRAEDILNCLIENYNRNWVEDKNKIANSTSLFIDDRLAVIEQELGNVDSNISDFQSQNLVPDVKAANQMYMQQANAASEKAADLSNQLYMARSLRQYVTNPANQLQLLPVNSGVKGLTVESLITKVNEKLLQRQALGVNSGANNPVIQDIDKQIAEYRASLVQSIDNEITALQTQINSYMRTTARSNAQMATNPDRSKYLLSVERQQKVKEQLYLYLLQKREENELSQAFTAYNTRIITPPMGGDAPTAPQSSKLLFLGFIVGLIIPLAYIYLREVFTTVVRGRKDLDNMNVPFAGELPLSSEKGLSKRERLAQRHQLKVRADSRNIINEAFRIVCTNLEFVAGPKTDNPAKTMMVTSLNPGSGKTFVAMNLAATYAISGQRTLVIDLDIRKSSASRFVGRPKEGITGILSGVSEDWHSIVTPVTDYPNLSVLPAGRSVPNPTELLKSSRLTTIIEQARSEYDLIIFDCPPYEVVADATLVSQYADLTLFIIRCGLFQRAMRSKVEQIYNDQKFPRLNVILNGAEAATSRYGYNRYGYGFGYGYGYGYGNYYSNKSTSKD